MGKAWLMGVLVAIGCSSDIEYVDDKDAGAAGGSAGTHSLDAASEWGTGGTSPVDSGTDAVADATQADVLQACANVLHFNIAAEADSIITPENGNCTYQKGSINHGPDPALLVGLDDCPDRSEAIVRFPISAQLGTAFSSGQVLDVALVLSADPAYKTNFVAGSVNVFAMTSAWDEGTGAYDGAQWYFAKAACTCAPSPSCCNYESKWELPGAAGPADRQGQAAGTMNIPSAPDVVSIDLEPAQLAPRVGAKLSVLLQTPDVLKLFFRSVQGKSAPSLLGNYCADP